MTGVAGVIDVVCLEQVVVVAVMHVMAVTAGHAAEAQRMPGRLVGVRAGPRVTVEADFLLLERIKNQIPITVDHVAGHTSDVCILVRAAKPAEVRVVLMASQAGLILFGNGSLIACAKASMNWCVLLLFGLDVFIRRAMAGFALLSSKRAHPGQCVSRVWC